MFGIERRRFQVKFDRNLESMIGLQTLLLAGLSDFQSFGPEESV